MRKFLVLLFILMSWNNLSYAEITLYCKQKIRVITEAFNKDKKETIPMEQDWKFIITDKEILVPGLEAMYSNLMRTGEDETTYFAADKAKYMLDGKGILYYTNIQISRTTGAGRMMQIIGNVVTTQPFVCTNKKPKILF